MVKNIWATCAHSTWWLYPAGDNVDDDELHLPETFPRNAGTNCWTMKHPQNWALMKKWISFWDLDFAGCHTPCFRPKVRDEKKCHYNKKCPYIQFRNGCSAEERNNDDHAPAILRNAQKLFNLIKRSQPQDATREKYEILEQVSRASSASTFATRKSSDSARKCHLIILYSMKQLPWTLFGSTSNVILNTWEPVLETVTSWIEKQSITSGKHLWNV